MKAHLATTRFNSETWNENQDFIKSVPHKCVYNVDVINTQLPADVVFVVLEMHNDKNRIMGIGMIKNKPYYSKYKIYSNLKYNQYTYIGKYRIDRSELDPDEEVIMKVFDRLCFKGSSHLKRLRGIKAFPEKTLDKCNAVLNLNEFVINMFKKRFT